MPDKLFHLCGIMLEPGSVIQAGNWGRNTRRIGWSNPSGKQLTEAHLEDTRQRYFAHLPSRLESAFCFLFLEDVRKFIINNQSFMGHILYEVELKDPQSLSAAGPVSLVAPSEMTYPTYRTDWAHQYWKAITPLNIQGGTVVAHSTIREKYGSECIEIFTHSPLIIKSAFQLTNTIF